MNSSSDAKETTTPAGISARFQWMRRIILPQLVVCFVVQKVLASAVAADLDDWKQIDWQVLFDGDVAAFDFDGFAHNLGTANAVTKIAAAVAAVIAGTYIVDLLTSGRRSSWCLLANPWKTGLAADVKFWAGLMATYSFISGLAMYVSVAEICSPETAFKFFIIVHLIILVALIIANRNFNAFVLLLPAIYRSKQIKRQRRGEKRAKRQKDRQRRNQLERQRRDQLNAHQQRLLALQASCERINSEISALETSDAPDDVVEEQAALLVGERTRIEKEVDEWPHQHQIGDKYDVENANEKGRPRPRPQSPNTAARLDPDSLGRRCFCISSAPIEDLYWIRSEERRSPTDLSLR